MKTPRSEDSIRQKLANLKKALDSNPIDVEVAKLYWVELATLGGHDVRSVGFAIEAFRTCALASSAGVVALAQACRELFDKTGEKPRPQLFDQELLNALKTSLPELSNETQRAVQWVLASVG